MTFCHFSGKINSVTVGLLRFLGEKLNEMTFTNLF